MSGLGFYDEYLKLMGNMKDKPDLATPYKIEYLKNIIQNGKVYKFISLEENAEIKISTLFEGKIWFSFYITLNDETEFEIDYKVKKVIGKTGYKKEYIDLIVNYLTEMYNVYSLTYVYQDDMWQYYAANGNGICVEFEVGDYDYLYLVEYCDKSKIDFTRMVISALKRSGMELSIIPWVVKNPYNQTADMDSTKEKEVRMLYCPYDLAEFNGGTIAFNIKERKGYKGIAKPYEDFKLKIEFNITDNDMIPYYSIDLYDISSEPIKEIILGPKNNILDRDFELYAAKYNMKNIVFRHSEISFRG